MLIRGVQVKLMSSIRLLEK